MTLLNRAADQRALCNVFYWQVAFWSTTILTHCVRLSARCSTACPVAWLWNQSRRNSIVSIQNVLRRPVSAVISIWTRSAMTQWSTSSAVVFIYNQLPSAVVLIQKTTSLEFVPSISSSPRKSSSNSQPLSAVVLPQHEGLPVRGRVAILLSVVLQFLASPDWLHAGPAQPDADYLLVVL